LGRFGGVVSLQKGAVRVPSGRGYAPRPSHRGATANPNRHRQTVTRKNRRGCGLCDCRGGAPALRHSGERHKTARSEHTSGRRESPPPSASHRPAPARPVNVRARRARRAASPATPRAPRAARAPRAVALHPARRPTSCLASPPAPCAPETPRDAPTAAAVARRHAPRPPRPPPQDAPPPVPAGAAPSAVAR